MDKLNEFGKCAIWYAQKGWRVHPLKPKDKIPLLKGWKDKASNDINVVYDWWSQSYKNSNIGLATGQATGIIVIDLDGQIAEERLTELQLCYEPFPDTVQARTGKGRHIYFKYPVTKEPIKIKSDKNILTDEHCLDTKIDIRADGGNLVLPPSIHPDGGQYQWIKGKSPKNVEIAECPLWLFALLLDDGIIEQQNSDIVMNYQTNHSGELSVNRPLTSFENDILSYLDGLGEGELIGRNNACAKLTGYFLRKYIPPAIVFELIKEWNKKNEPSLKPDELIRTFNSVLKAETIRQTANKK